MLGTALYYPHLDIHDSAWLKSAVLFWDEIKTIAPRSIKQPYQKRDTKILWKEGYLEPLRCDLYPELIESLGKRVAALMDQGYPHRGANLKKLKDDPNHFALMNADKVGFMIRSRLEQAHIHPDKLSPAMRGLAVQVGLARMHSGKIDPDLVDLMSDLSEVPAHLEPTSSRLRYLTQRASRIDRQDGEWLLVDSDFAWIYMSALAALLSKEADISALTNKEKNMGVNLHNILDDVTSPTNSEKKGALVSIVIENLRIDPETKIENIIKFRRARENQLGDLAAQFEDVSGKILECESAIELKEKVGHVYATRIRPKMENLKKELADNSIQSLWEGVQRCVTVTIPVGSGLSYFSGLTGTTLLAAGAALTISDVAIKSYLAQRKARRASPYSYLLDIEQKFRSV